MINANPTAVLCCFTLAVSLAGCDSGDEEKTGEEPRPAPEQVRVDPLTVDAVKIPKDPLQDIPLPTGPIEKPEPGDFLRYRDVAETTDDGESLKYRVKVFRSGDPLKDGPYSQFYASGDKLCQGQYRDGDRTGEWTWWYENGTIAKKVVFDDDQPAKETFYREDGTKEREIHYRGGRRVQEILYDEQGNVSRQRDLEAGSSDQ
jgi:hypothetical protein